MPFLKHHEGKCEVSNEKNVVYILNYCWPYFKELMELENGLFLSTLSTASLLCTLVL